MAAERRALEGWDAVGVEPGVEAVDCAQLPLIGR